MKWIGQHIWDYISRFRNDVYLEDISTGTIASGGNLGLDSNNKIVKADTEAGELTIANATDNRVVTSLGGTDLNAESKFTWNGNECALSSLVDTYPLLSLTCTASSGGAGPGIDFIMADGSNSGVSGDYAGTINFKAENDANEETLFASIAARVNSAADTDESGLLSIRVAASNGTNSSNRNFLNGVGHSTNDVVDVGIGYGATSTTTIAGDLDIDGDTITSAGALKIQPADISGQALIIDADADIDNEVEINAGLLDINTTAAITIDAGHNIDIESTKCAINKTYDFHANTFETIYSSDQGTGTIIKYSPVSSSSLNGSEIYYLRANATWAQANADAVASSGPCLLGVGLGGDPQTVGILLKGFVRVAYTEILNVPGSGAVDGLPVYLSDAAAGHFDFDAPSDSGHVVRIVGYAIDDYTDSGNTDVLVYFDPDKTWVEIG